MIKLEKKRLLATLVALPLGLVLSAHRLVSEPIPVDITTLLIGGIFGSVTFNGQSVFVTTFQNLSFILLFVILFANYLAEDFRCGAIYVFSRINKRRRWYRAKAVELSVYAGIYLALYFAVQFALCARLSTLPYDPSTTTDILLLALYAFLLMLNLVTMANLLAMYVGVTVGIVVVTVIVSILIFLAMQFSGQAWMRAINPMTCLSFLEQTGAVRTCVFGGNLLISVVLQSFAPCVVERYDVAMFDPELN